MVRTRVKICCIASVDEARLAVRAGADALGLVGRMPSGPGPLPDPLIREIASTVPPGVDTFLLTSETTPRAVVEHVERCGASVVQLVAEVGPEVYEALSRELPAVRVVQVVHVEDRDAIARADALADRVHAVLLDSGRPGAATAELGGTGRVHDWSISAQIVRRLRDRGQPVYLAGGMRPENVGRALAAVRPFGVDLCTGVRENERLDPSRLDAFFAAVREFDLARSARRT